MIEMLLDYAGGSRSEAALGFPPMSGDALGLHPRSGAALGLAPRVPRFSTYPFQPVPGKNVILHLKQKDVCELVCLVVCLFLKSSETVEPNQQKF